MIQNDRFNSIFNSSLGFKSPFLLQNSAFKIVGKTLSLAESIALTDGVFHIGNRTLSVKQIRQATSNIDSLINKLFENIPNHPFKNELLYSKELLLNIEANFVTYNDRTDRKIHALAFAAFNFVNKKIRYSTTRPFCNTRAILKEPVVLKEIIRRFFILQLLDIDSQWIDWWEVKFAKSLQTGDTEIFLEDLKNWLVLQKLSDQVEKEIEIEDAMPKFLQNNFAIQRLDFLCYHKKKANRSNYKIGNAQSMAKMVFQYLRKKCKADLMEVEYARFPLVFLNNQNKPSVFPRGENCWVVDAFHCKVYRVGKLLQNLRLPKPISILPEETTRIEELKAKTKAFDPENQRLLLKKTNRSLI